MGSHRGVPGVGTPALGRARHSQEAIGGDPEAMLCSWRPGLPGSGSLAISHPASPRMAPKRSFPGVRGLQGSCRPGPEWAALHREHVDLLWGLGLYLLCSVSSSLHVNPAGTNRSLRQLQSPRWAPWGRCRQEGWKLFRQRVGFSSVSFGILLGLGLLFVFS